MDRQTIDMLLAFTLTFALQMVVYGIVFVYSFKRRRHFILRAACSLLALGAVGVGGAFAMYGLFAAGLDPQHVLYIEVLRAVMFILFVALDIVLINVCFDEKPALVLFAAVATNAAITVGSALYSMVVEAFHLNSIYFTMYGGADVWSFVAFFLIHIAVIFLAWLLFGKAFARAHKDFGKSINKFVIGLYVMYAFFTAAVSRSQFFNMTLMGINTKGSIAIPLIFNGFSAFFAVFVLFVQRFNLTWSKDLQDQEAAESFHQHYKDRVDKQQASVVQINSKVEELKDQIHAILADQHLDEGILADLENAISIFDSTVQTGCDALDVLLTQKSLNLDSKHVSTTLMVDGKALSFMEVSDVNAFFGNAIDNALEYLETVDEDKRFLRISTTRNHSLLAVRIENYCDKDLTFGQDGRPHSTKKGDSHGYGTQSIKSVAQKYGGTATFAREGDLFVINALFSASEAF